MKRERNGRGGSARLPHAIINRAVRRLATMASIVAVIGVGLATPAVANTQQDVGINAEIVGLKVRLSDKCLDYTGPRDNATVIQYTCSGLAAQRWEIRPHDGIFSKVINQNSGRCLDVFGGSREPLAGIILRPCDSGSTSQQWAFDFMSEGVYRIWARHSLLCLDLYRNDPNDFARFVQFDCVRGGHPAQQFFKV